MSSSAPAATVGFVNSDFDACPNCGATEEWQPEHAHQRCRACGFIEPCCEGAPLGE